MSGDGRYVAFTSSDTMHVHDRQTGKTQSLGGGYRASITPDGRYVAFQTGVPRGEYVSDIVVVDRQKHVSETVSVSTKERPANSLSEQPSISADGRFVAFESWASNFVPGDTISDPNVFVRDRKKGTTRCVDVDRQGRLGNGESRGASISASGRYVAFVSYATNLIPHDNNRTTDVFVRDLKNSRTRRVSISTSRAAGNSASGFVASGRGQDTAESAISGDGHFVAFPSYATNLAPPEPPDARDPLAVFVRGPLSP
jgi:Tol biopolymer transport system component